MRTITIFNDCHGPYTLRWLKPMLAAKKEFKELGYNVELSSWKDYLPMGRIRGYENTEMSVLKKAQTGKYDIVFLAFHHSASILGSMNSTQRAEILSNIKKHCNLLVWLDTADSTGTCLFDVMPYVDLYFKKQILKNVEIYTQDIWGGRTFCEYYHELLGVDDPVVTNRHYEKLDSQYLHKLRLSWNVGLGDLYCPSPIKFYLFANKVFKPDFVDCDSERTLDLQYRGSGYSPIAGYPRSKSLELLLNINSISICDVTKKIPKEEYILEGQKSKSILSPFGWGEICGRDFEAIVYGATMIKQSMEHCITYPNIYQPWVTYVPLKWDFSDFNEIVSKAASEEYRNIAKNAQEYYKFFYTKAGQKDFAKHIINELERK